ncbi:MAG: D-alanyl-D-alanine carboxypeptidase family protein [Coprococcus sp.]
MKKKYLLIISLMIFTIFTLCGCGKKTYNTKNQLELGLACNMPVYGTYGMAGNFAVIGDGENINESAYKKTASALLINDTTKEPIVAYNVHEKIYPASMTKIMTGLLVIESIEQNKLSLDKVVTLDHTITFDEWDVMASSLTGGCQVTVKNLLYSLLIRSYNDCAVLLAEEVAGSQSAFVDMMNEKAFDLGAVNTHFENPHGLHSDDHYTTAYDLYIIFSEFIKHDLAYVIDSLPLYDFTYIDEFGETQTIEIEPTNGFLSDEFNLPDGYSLGSWKSGTTDEAGNCLILEFVKNSTGDRYIAVVAGAEDRDTLYKDMTNLIKLAE